MLGPSRPLPRVGAAARIKHFGGDFESGTVVGVHDGGRRLRVRIVLKSASKGEGQAEDLDGELHEFVLNPANARFVSADSAHGPWLELVGEPV